MNRYAIAETIVTEPTEEPLSLTELKAFIRVTGNDENKVIQDLSKAVRRYCEKLTGRAFCTQTWKAFYGGWPKEHFLLPYAPLVSVTHVKYYDTDGDATTWSSADYIVDTDSEPGRVVLGYSKSWPSITLYPANPIEIQYVCGYGAASAVPESIKTMIAFGLERLYDKPTGDYKAILNEVFRNFMLNDRVYQL